MTFLPEDWQDALLLGRLDLGEGPTPVLIVKGEVIDISAAAPTTSAFLNGWDGKVPAGKSLGAISDLALKPHWEGDKRLLAPVDLQCVKAAGVTFAVSAVERVIEERARGDASKANAIRADLKARVGADIKSVRPGSEEAARLKAALIADGLWSQYLEVAIGPDAEVFTKCPPLAAVGWGAEIGAFFDATKLHVYNEGRGGRSSRGYIEEGAWARILEQLQPGDFVIVQFAHNDTANSANYPDRATINSGGEEVVQVGVGEQRKIIHTYGWYLRKYAADAKAKGATLILCSPVPRNQWVDGKMKRGFDGYAQWAADAAKATGVAFIDLNALVCDRYDALGQERTRPFYADNQHTTKAGARVNAECVVAGIRALKDTPLARYLK